jgi:hypothetical protein
MGERVHAAPTGRACPTEWAWRYALMVTERDAGGGKVPGRFVTCVVRASVLGTLRVVEGSGRR